MIKTLRFILVTLLLASGLIAVRAQDNHIVYYLAPDSTGRQQVYQHLLDGQSQPRQLSQSASEVLSFGVAYDGLSVAYVSAGQLWLQPVHSEDAEALAPISATRFFGSPVYSQDGNYIAYADDGVWLLDLASRDSHQLVANVPLAENASNANEYRLYAPEVFVQDTGGRTTHLVVDVGIWEWNTVGVYDLASGQLQELEGQVHTDLLPLEGGALLYGNGGVAGEFALHFVENLDDINSYRKVVDFSAVTDATLFADQAVEIAPGTVRVLGSALGSDPSVPTAFYFDVDLMSNTAYPAQVFALPVGSEDFSMPGAVSPDGALLLIYQQVYWTDNGAVYGTPQILELSSNEAVTLELPQTIGEFRWQP